MKSSYPKSPNQLHQGRGSNWINKSSQWLSPDHGSHRAPTSLGSVVRWVMWKLAEGWKEWGDGRRIWGMGMRTEKSVKNIKWNMRRYGLRQLCEHSCTKSQSSRTNSQSMRCSLKIHDGWSQGTWHRMSLAMLEDTYGVKEPDPCPQGACSPGWRGERRHPDHDTKKASPQRFPTKCNGTHVAMFWIKRGDEELAE